MSCSVNITSGQGPFSNHLVCLQRLQIQSRCPKCNMKGWSVHIAPLPTQHISALGFNPVIWLKWRLVWMKHAILRHWFSMPSSAIYLVSLRPSSAVCQAGIINMSFSISKLVWNFHAFIIRKFLPIFRKRWSYILKMVQKNLNNSSILPFL